MIAPSAVSRAAPTLNPENAACAFSRARLAASMREAGSETLNDTLQQRDELTTDTTCRLQDLGMVEWLGQYPGGHVGDARDPENLDPHVSRSDRFGDRRHPDGIGTDRTKVANLGRRLVTGSKE